jgi:phage baseplate assembly protein W
MAHKNIILTPANIKAQTTVKSSQFYRGFSTVDESAISVRLYDYDVVKQDLLNQLNTRRGERVMNPTFGTIIWDLIYEPLTPDVKKAIAADIDKILSSDPRVVPIQVNIVEQDYGFYLELTVKYANTDKSEQIKLLFDRNVGLMA